jgi:hypothetical protein
MKRLLLAAFLIILVAMSGCFKDFKEEQQKNYEKCTSICSSVLSEDYVTLHLCNEECKKEFLGEGETAP